MSIRLPEFSVEADDLRRRRVRRQAQADPQGVVLDRDGSSGAVEGLDRSHRAGDHCNCVQAVLVFATYHYPLRIAV